MIDVERPASIDWEAEVKREVNGSMGLEELEVRLALYTRYLKAAEERLHEAEDNRERRAAQWFYILDLIEAKRMEG